MSPCTTVASLISSEPSACKVTVIGRPEEDRAAPERPQAGGRNVVDHNVVLQDRGQRPRFASRAFSLVGGNGRKGIIVGRKKVSGPGASRPVPMPEAVSAVASVSSPGVLLIICRIVPALASVTTVVAVGAVVTVTGTTAVTGTVTVTGRAAAGVGVGSRPAVSVAAVVSVGHDGSRLADHSTLGNGRHRGRHHGSSSRDDGGPFDGSAGRCFCGCLSRRFNRRLSRRRVHSRLCHRLDRQLRLA